MTDKHRPKVTTVRVTVNLPKPTVEDLMAANQEYLDEVETKQGKDVADRLRERMRAEFEEELANAPDGPVEIPMVHIGEMMSVVIGLAVAATISAVALLRNAA